MTPHAHQSCPQCHAATAPGAAHCGHCGAPQPTGSMGTAKTVMMFGGASAAAAAPPAQHQAPPAQAWSQAAPPQQVPIPAAPQPQGWNQAAAGAQGWQQPAPAAGWQQPQHQAAGASIPGVGSGLSRKKILGGIAGAVVVAALGVAGTIVKNKYMGPKGKRVASWSKLGVDGSKARPDELISAVGGMARKWRKDAAWWSVNVMGVRPDGTVDLKNGGIAKVEYISPSGVASKAKSKRKDSIKAFQFNARGVKADKILGARKPWENVVLPSAPSCTVEELVATLRDRGFADGTVRISFDPKTAFASGGYHWRVWSDAAGLAGYYSMDDCGFVQAAAGG